MLDAVCSSSSQFRLQITPPNHRHHNHNHRCSLNFPRRRNLIASSLPPPSSNYISQAILSQKFPDGSPSSANDAANPLPKPLTSSVASKSDGSRLRVAYQGVNGAYSELAAETAYPNCEAVPCDQFDTAFEALERWLVDRAVLPIENSLGGSIHRNYDLLLRHRLHIVGEVKLPIRHCLLANPGVKIDELKRVLSHPQALAQCEHTLAKFGVTREAVDDTAGAAKFVAFNKLKDAGAVASAAAARIYGLNVLAEDIQDDSDNVTRFLMLAREPIIPGSDRPFKTSIVFSHTEGPGALFKALAVFALRHINLTKIESRPLRNSNNGSSKCFDYLFYLDFEASMADPNAQNALRHLGEFATLLRVLGSYPADTSRRLSQYTAIVGFVSSFRKPSRVNDLISLLGLFKLSRCHDNDCHCCNFDFPAMGHDPLHILKEMENPFL